MKERLIVIMVMCGFLICAGCHPKETQQTSTESADAVQQPVADAADTAGNADTKDSAAPVAENCTDSKGCQLNEPVVAQDDAKDAENEVPAEAAAPEVNRYTGEVIPSGYKMYSGNFPADMTKPINEVKLECIQKEGCKCGDDICPEGDLCQNGICKSIECRNDEMANTYVSYCHNPKGCKCGSGTCPEGAICEDVEHLYTTDETVQYVCMKTDIVVSDGDEDAMMKMNKVLCNLDEDNADRTIIYMETYKKGKLVEPKKGKSK